MGPVRPSPWGRPWKYPHRGQTQSLYGCSTLSLALHTTSADLLHAASAWQDDLAPFPHRASNHQR